MTVIGLTGQTGAGKSTVSALFRERGIPVLDADQIYNELLDSSESMRREMTSQFGDIFLPNGTLNREKLGSIVFSDRDKLGLLNSVTHKYVMEEVKRRIAERNDKMVIFDAPQLFEANGNEICDAVISVIADEEIRLKRIIDRDCISKDKAIMRMKAQHDEQFFLDYSDYILENNGTIQELRENAEQLLQYLLTQYEN